MCLSVPGKVIEIYDEDDFKMGRVDFSGVVQRICLQYVPDILLGQYVLVHVGFAIARIDEAEAAKTLDLLRELAETQQKLSQDGTT
jgi:hydrogenase expression/formation protein HypC